MQCLLQGQGLNIRVKGVLNPGLSIHRKYGVLINSFIFYYLPHIGTTTYCTSRQLDNRLYIQLRLPTKLYAINFGGPESLNIVIYSHHVLVTHIFCEKYSIYCTTKVYSSQFNLALNSTSPKILCIIISLIEKTYSTKSRKLCSLEKKPYTYNSISWSVALGGVHCTGETSDNSTTVG